MDTDGASVWVWLGFKLWLYRTDRRRVGCIIPFLPFCTVSPSLNNVCILIVSSALV